MEPNSKIPQTPTPAPQPTPNTFTSTGGNQAEENSSKKFVLMLVVGVIIVMALVGGIYLFLSRQQASSEANQIPTPVPVIQENLENDLNTIEVANPDADFTSLDSDLQQL